MSLFTVGNHYASDLTTPKVPAGRNVDDGVVPARLVGGAVARGFVDELLNAMTGNPCVVEHLYKAILIRPGIEKGVQDGTKRMDNSRRVNDRDVGVDRGNNPAASITSICQHRMLRISVDN